MEQFKENTEYPIGTIVNTKYGKAIVRENIKCCSNCIFHDTAYCHNIPCVPALRKDSQSIYFKPIKEKTMEKGTVVLSLEDAKKLYNQGGEFKTIALSAYSEEELNPSFKDGDFVVSGWKHHNEESQWIAIFAGSNPYCYNYYAALILKSNSGNEGKVKYYENAGTQTYNRIASKAERFLLLTALAKEGKKWNSETKKIEDIYVPKDGDFVYYSYKCWNDTKEYITISTGHEENFYIEYNITENKLDLFPATKSRDYNKKRPASLGEITDFMNALHKEGKDWDTENKKVIPHKWKPLEGEEYWAVTVVYVSKGFDAIPYSWKNDIINNSAYEMGLVFKTKEKAENKAKELNSLCNFK